MNGQSWPPDGLASSALDDTLVAIVYLMKDLLPHAVGNHNPLAPEEQLSSYNKIFSFRPVWPQLRGKGMFPPATQSHSIG